MKHPPTILCATIMHSGSHVLLDGVLNRRKLINRAGKFRYRVHHAHLHLYKKPPPSQFTFSSLRHPRRIAESWKRRGKSGRFENEFRGFIEAFHPRVDLYVHVDDPEIRDQQAKAIRYMIGVTLPPVRWQDRFASVKHTIDIDINDCPPVPDEFIEFYESCKQL